MRSFADPLPLRTTAAWALYREVRPIPERYGPVQGELLQYDKERRKFVWANHACSAITAVKVSGQSVQNWIFYNGTDIAGHEVAFVEFSQPVADDVVVTAIGVGKMHPRTGRAFTNPADVLWDLVSNVAGIQVEEAALDVLRFECSELDVTIAGSALSNQITIQSQATALCRSIGAVFSTAMPSLGRIFPGGELDAFDTFAIDGRHELEPNGNRSEITNVVDVFYDYDDNGPRQVLRAEAPSSIDRYGRNAAVIEARWIDSSRVAYGVATRRLQWRARPVWSFTASGLRTDRIRPGDAGSIQHARSPFTGRVMALETALQPGPGIMSVSFQAAVGDVPRVVLTQQSAVIESQQYASIAVQTVGSERVLFVNDAAGNPMAAARVVLDGTFARYTDGAGKVVFPVSEMLAGEHNLEVTSADGSQSFGISVLVQ